MSKLFVASAITLGLLLVFVTGGIMVVLLFANAVNLYFAIGVTVIVGLISLLIGPFFTDLLSRWLYKLKFHSEEEVKQLYPAVWEIVHEVSTEKGFRFPKIGIIPDENPTAYTYGSGRYNARMVMTKGLFTYLNDDEVKAVVAHELGHIVNRDFIVMMVASILLQVLYEIYAALMRARGKKAGSAHLIGFGFYAIYIVGIFLVYYLSRTREYLADAYSATKVAPAHLAKALVKIGYGILSTHDEKGQSDRLLRSSRHLGIIDVKNAKHVGVSAALAHDDVNALSEVMAFDALSPWAKLIQINSTHPLTGNRLLALEAIADAAHSPFPYDIDTALARVSVDRSKMYKLFFRDLAVLALPIILPVVGVFFAPAAFVPGLVGLGLLFVALYKYPAGIAPRTTILDQMRNPYASPVHGVPIKLDGKVIGRGMPGYVFSEDLMLQDSTGLTFLNYTSAFAWLGNIFFALTKVKKLLGEKVAATGWFFRSMSSSVSLKGLDTGTEKIKSYPFAWALVWPILLFVWSGYLYTYASPEYRAPLDFATIFASDAPADIEGWKKYEDKELGIQFQYPADYDLQSFGSADEPVMGHRISHGNKELLTISVVPPRGSSVREMLDMWLGIYNKRDGARGIAWAMDDSYMSEGMYSLYPELPPDYAGEINPVYIEVFDFEDNYLLTVSLHSNALDPVYRDDIVGLLDSLSTNKVPRPGI